MSLSREAPGNPYAITDDRHHTYNARVRMKLLSDQLKQDAARVTDERTRAMIETAGVVVNALISALTAQEEGARIPWRR
jgi:hypothetical protein